MGLKVSEYWGVGILGCRNIGLSEYWDVTYFHAIRLINIDIIMLIFNDAQYLTVLSISCHKRRPRRSPEQIIPPQSVINAFMAAELP